MNDMSPARQPKLIDTRQTPDPALSNTAITGERYTSAAFMEREWEGMWTKVWLIGCLESEVKSAGEFVTTEIGRESILIARGQDGVLRAFFNVCQHRGNRLVQKERGVARAFTCAYHGWVYDADGAVKSAEDAWDFPEGDPCATLRLSEIACDTWGGFVWFNMNKDAMPLADFLAPVAEQLDTYAMQNMVRTQYYTIEVDCNWKVIQDNFQESYHIRVVHPQLPYMVEDKAELTQFDMYPTGHARMLMRGMAPGERYADKIGAALPAQIKGMMQAIGMDPGAYQGRPQDVRLAIQRHKRENAAALGFDYDGYTDEQLTDQFHYTLFPNLSLSMIPEGCAFLRANPHPTDPNKCLFDFWMLAHIPAVAETARGQAERAAIMSEAEGESLARPQRLPGKDEYLGADGAIYHRDQHVPHERFRHGERSLGIIFDQDLELAPVQQLGLASRGFKRAYLSHQERRVRFYHDEIDRYLSGEKG